MTRDEVKRIFALLKVAYSSFVPESREEAEAKVNLWTLMFDKTSYREAEWAAKRCIESCTFPPTIADMKQFLGMERTRDDVQAMLPFKEYEPKYANEAYMEAKFMECMRRIDEK